MSVLSDPRRFRRLLAGLGLTLGSALLVVVELIHPENDSDAAQLYASVSQNGRQWYLAHALALVALALAVPAVLGLMHMLKGSRPGWGHVGAAITFLGMMPLAAIIGTEFVVWQTTAGESGAMIALLDRFNDSPGIVLLYVLALLFPIGWVALAAGLYLARAVPAWQPALLGGGMVILFAGDAAFVKWLTIVGAIVFFLGAAPIGWRLLTESDEEWEAAGPAEYRAVPTA